MAQAKAQTMQARFGFEDKELTTPKHDEIMLWLDQWVDTNLHTITGGWVGIASYDNEKDWRNKKFISLADFGQPIPDYPSIKVLRKTWECAITNKNYTIGFADMWVKFNEPSLVFFRDEGKLKVNYSESEIYFEVKPTIPSLGEVIRQVRMYQTYTAVTSFNTPTYAKWFIVSPDAKFKSQLESQRIGFVEVK